MQNVHWGGPNRAGLSDDLLIFKFRVGCPESRCMSVIKRQSDTITPSGVVAVTRVRFGSVSQSLRALGALDQTVAAIDPLNSDLGRRIPSRTESVRAASLGG
ncbi:hypothetical protein GCG21_04055 [Pseudactinotalea sp. HY160]|nr:hypothetical protein [Pseudactinotalea sp. HY160]